MKKASGVGWNIWRGVVGTSYLVAAAFNLFFTLPKGDLRSFADNAWSSVLVDFVIEVVVPHRTLFMVLVVVFEVAVALLIFGRGRSVSVGAGASVLWVLFLIPFLQPFPMAATNVLLAAAQGILLLRRFDAPIWDMFRSPRG